MSAELNIHFNADLDQNAKIQVTDSAAHKVYELIQEENNPDLKLRVFVNGGGCSGFQYGFSFEEKVNEDDFEIVKKFVLNQQTLNDTSTGKDTTDNTNIDTNTPVLDTTLASSETESTNAEIKLLIDAQSFAYLKGAEIDYRKDIHGEQFIIRNNPNIKTTCGCGSSFAVE